MRVSPSLVRSARVSRTAPVGSRAPYVPLSRVPGPGFRSSPIFSNLTTAILPCFFSAGCLAGRSVHAMAATEWITAFDKKPSERTCRDIELICGRLRRVETLSRLPHSVISHLAHHAYYEDVDRGVTLYRQGEMGTSWYLVLTGSLEVKATQEKEPSQSPENLVQLTVMNV
ncbi:hypothetical protein GE061_014765 [Apolygus lucorum]|uniref:Cyclic nucleotide-binding domain-containing protein n=1 Tax=Apolygus lucorum TaxID=248454 RepID=A0A8S9XJ39_APOLU|nr:hypothetical protein GE061_014765 [Apolygus lucorum]